jgi:hypothetical protein
MNTLYIMKGELHELIQLFMARRQMEFVYSQYTEKALQNPFIPKHFFNFTARKQLVSVRREQF